MTVDPLAIAASVATDVVAPNAASWDRERRQPIDELKAALGAGIGAIAVPTELGGLGAPPSTLTAVARTLAAECAAFAFTVVVHNNSTAAIARSGTERHRADVLPDLVAGEQVVAFLLTEPGAGSDAAAITTTATPEGDGWRIDGEKAWVTNGANASVLNTFVQTDPGSRHRGIASFLIEADRPGVTRLAPYELAGGSAMGVCGFRFDGCHVGPDDMLLPPGQGFAGAMAGIDLARTIVGAMCCGMLARSLDIAVAHTADRALFGTTSSGFQGVTFPLADVATDLEAARLLVDAAAAKLDAGEGATTAAAHAKKFGTTAAERGIIACMQAMGAAGARLDVPLARHLATTRLASYQDGTTEIQNVVIARSLWGVT